MYEYAVNRNTLKMQYVPLAVSDMTWVDEYTMSIKSVRHNFRDGDTLRVNRNINNKLITNNFYTVKVIDDDHFSITPPVTDYFVIKEKKVEKIPYFIDKDGSIEYVKCLILSFENRHNFVKLQQLREMKESIGLNYYENVPYSGIKRCPGDWVVFNRTFEYAAKGVKNTGHYILNKDKRQNRDDVYMWYTDGNGDKAYVYNGIVPVNINGDEDRYRLIFIYDGTQDTVLDYIYDNLTQLYSDDIRYFLKQESNGVITYKLANDNGYNNPDDILGVKREDGNMYLRIPLGETFATDMHTEEIMSNYIEQREEEEINSIIDYEKVKFVPVYMDSNNVKTLVSDIKFNIHLRKRENYLNDAVLGQAIDTTEPKWTLANQGMAYWNNYTLDAVNRYLVKPDDVNMKDNDTKTYDSSSDALKCLGFDDGDVFYQKSRLGKSFIRLSFYDSPDRATQTLLYYATIFIDTNKKFKEYITANARYIKEGYDIEYIDYAYTPGDLKPYKDTKYSKTVFVVRDTKTKYNYTSSGEWRSADYCGEPLKEGLFRIGADFTCANSYDMSACSEGFYLYLYPNTVDGFKEKAVYMKAEFNHAKYGQTIPLTMPVSTVDDDYTPLNALRNTDFPIHYTVYDSSGTATGTDMNRLLKDQYIKVMVSYDSTLDKYVWRLPRVKDDYNGDTMVFNLYEPRINGFKDEKLNG